MKVYNKDTGEMVNLICLINEKNIASDVIETYVQINYESLNYGIYNIRPKNGSWVYSMTNKEINYWVDIFKCAEEVTFVKNEAYKNIDTDIDINLDENIMIETLSNGSFNYINLDDLVSELYHAYRICYESYFKNNKTKENMPTNNDELICRLDTLYSYVMGVKDCYSPCSELDKLPYCLDNIVKDIGEILTDLKNKKDDKNARNNIHGLR
jgi:hypothetical protein